MSRHLHWHFDATEDIQRNRLAIGHTPQDYVQTLLSFPKSGMVLLIFGISIIGYTNKANTFPVAQAYGIDQICIWTLDMNKYFAVRQATGGLLIDTFSSLFYLPMLYIRVTGTIQPGTGDWAC